jgi:hypothetical protein
MGVRDQWFVSEERKNAKRRRTFGVDRIEVQVM